MSDRDEVIVYKFDRDLEQILHNIVNQWNRNKDYKKRWNINPKEEVFVNVKLAGNVLELRVEGLRGGWRTSRVDQLEMERFAKEMERALKEAEKDLRKEFKEKSGKAFKWSRAKVKVNYEPIALNNLYKFTASKTGEVKVTVERQEHSEGSPKLNKAKTDKPDSWKLIDVGKLSDKWG